MRRMERNEMHTAGRSMLRCVNKRQYFFLFLLVVCYFFFTFFGNGCDNFFHFERIRCLAEEIKVRGIWNYPYYIYGESFHGMGYAMSSFYPDVFLFPPALMYLAGCSIRVASSFWNGILIFLTFISIKHAIRYAGYSKENSVPIAFTYVLSNYIFFEAISRGTQGPNCVFLFAPWAYAVIIKVGKERNITGKQIMILALAIAGCFLSHLLSSIMVVVGLFLYVCFNLREYINWKIIGGIVVSAVLCILLTLWFLAPMLEQMAAQVLYVSSDKVDSGKWPLRMTILQPLHIFISNDVINVLQDYYYSRTGRYIARLASEKFIWTLPGCWWASICIWLACGKKIWGGRRKDNWRAVSMFGIGGFCLVFSFTSIFAFDSVFGFMQFLWRGMLIFVMIMPFLLSECLERAEPERLDKMRRRIVKIASACFLGYVLLIGSHLVSNSIFGYGTMPENLGSTQVGMGEYLPEEIPSTEFSDSYKKDSDITDVTYTSEGYNVQFEKVEERQYELPVVWYKGYTVETENGTIKPYKTDHGLVGVDGTDISGNTVIVKYKKTTIQKVSLCISCICIIGFVVGFIYSRKKRNTLY